MGEATWVPALNDDVTASLIGKTVRYNFKGDKSWGTGYIEAPAQGIRVLPAPPSIYRTFPDSARHDASVMVAGEWRDVRGLQVRQEDTHGPRRWNSLEDIPAGVDEVQGKGVRFHRSAGQWLPVEDDTPEGVQEFLYRNQGHLNQFAPFVDLFSGAGVADEVEAAVERALQRRGCEGGDEA